jgi:hypothetical protein
MSWDDVGPNSCHMDGTPITRSDNNPYVTVKLQRDQVGMLVTMFENSLAEMEKMLYVLANDINEAEIQMTHKSNNLPIVREAWSKVRDEAVEKMRELQSKFDNTQSIIEALRGENT